MNTDKNKFPLTPVIYTFLILIPIYWMATISLKTNKELGSGISLLPKEPTLGNYSVIFNDSAWYLGYMNAAFYVLINVALCLSFALPAAYAFSRFRFYGKEFLFFGFLTFRMMAPAIMLIPMVEIFSYLRLIDTYLAVALAHCYFNLPIAIWILEGFISAVPKNMDNQAKVDGYSYFQYFRKILIPQIAPGVGVTAFFCFLFSWTEVLLANALTVIDAKPINAIMTRVASVFVSNITTLSAAGLLTIIPGLFFVIFIRKYLVKGFSLGRID